MESLNLRKIEAGVIITLFILGGVFFPLSSALQTNENNIILDDNFDDYHPVQYSENDPYILPEDYLDNIKQTTLDDFVNDMGYNTDAGNRLQRSLSIYPGERIDNTPGRTMTGDLDPDIGDTEDWYKFYACEGQGIQVSIAASQSYDIELQNTEGIAVGKTYAADATGVYFAKVFANEGASVGSYTISVSINGQNDANTGSDSGDDINSATSISEGEYVGYMDINDVEDWYSFSVNSGQGISFYIEPMDKTDYDLHLYDPDGIHVHSEQYYGEDTMEYPADKTGNWKIKIDMFPGWDEDKWPDNYFLYGSGPYEFSLDIGGSFEMPSDPLPQPDIVPIAKTIIINDDPDSNKDEYGYIAAVPASNYIDAGQRYASPIIYNGVDDLTNWFGTIDDTTQYLIDDWTTYLDRHSLTADEYVLDDDPIQAAADIAQKYWENSNTAVLTCDGSEFTDDINAIIDDDFSFSSSPDISTYTADELKEFNGVPAMPMYIGSQWGVIHMIARGEGFGGDTGLLTPRYEEVGFDNWPHPYDALGPDYDTWYPISEPGVWIPELTDDSGLEELEIILYPGDRYNIPVDTTECSIEVNVHTDQEDYLIAYLIDPLGNVRRPTLPEWNGGEIKPLHWWNGGHWEHNFDEYRYWIVDPHTDFSFDMHYPMTGDWSLIIVPYFDHPDLYAEFDGEYHLTANIRNHNPDRVNAGISAANAAVIASSKHAPLLYVAKDSIPTETANALSSLGVNEIIFVNLNDVSSASPTGTVTEYNTMQEIVDTIKDNTFSENYITITSTGTGDGFFAPSAMIAAYHTSPVLNINEAAEGYDLIDKLVKWEEIAGAADFYHGCRTMGHLPSMLEPTNIQNPPSLIDLIVYFLTNNQELPPIGLDLKLQWYSGVYQSIYSMIDSYGLDLNGKEGYMFVAPRDTDIASHMSRVFMGNNSYAGHIMFDTPAMDAAQISRSILYPAIIFANNGRDVTSAVMMNHWEDNPWTTNDGVQHNNEVTRRVKQYYSSLGRTFEGHTIWDNLLERSNEGASVVWHCSHGTGGSALCMMYENVEEQFPLAELTHEHLKDFDWWDAWRAYYYDDSTTKTPRNNGRVWFNAVDDPYNNLYDPIHFKWVDQLFENLHSQINLWMSCTTSHNFGPEIYLEHGCVLYYGNSNTGRSPQTDFQDSTWFEDFLVNGRSIGEAQTEILWNFDRDYTTLDPTSIYGESTTTDGGLVNTWVIFGDPALQLYNPTWYEPTPITG
ncbi:hypothetical protein ACFL1L_01930 [Thermoplasmatota archaeon]